MCFTYSPLFSNIIYMNGQNQNPPRLQLHLEVEQEPHFPPSVWVPLTPLEFEHPPLSSTPPTRLFLSSISRTLVSWDVECG